MALHVLYSLSESDAKPIHSNKITIWAGAINFFISTQCKYTFSKDNPKQYHNSPQSVQSFAVEHRRLSVK